MSNEDKMQQKRAEFAEGFSHSDDRLSAMLGWDEGMKACAAIKDAEIAELKAHINRSSLERYNSVNGDQETDVVERLRFFCSLAMSDQDWLDVESFFDDVIAEIASRDKELRGTLDKIAFYEVRTMPKTDLCKHGKYGYEDCEECIALFAQESLANSEHHNSRALVECGNCFNGKSDMDHTCQKCNGTGFMSPQLHADDIAVDNFAVAMKVKLKVKREQGKSGWQFKDACSKEFLSKELVEHIAKGDPVDVANFCMMLQQRGETINSRALEKMLLEARIEEVESCDSVAAVLRVLELKAKLAELNKE